MASMQAANRTDAQATQVELESKEDAAAALPVPTLPTVRRSKRHANMPLNTNPTNVPPALRRSNRLAEPTTISKASQNSSKVEKGMTFIHNSVMYHITSVNKKKSVVYASDDLQSKVRFNLEYVEEII